MQAACNAIAAREPRHARPDLGDDPRAGVAGRVGRAAASRIRQIASGPDDSVGQSRANARDVPEACANWHDYAHLPCQLFLVGLNTIERQHHLCTGRQAKAILMLFDVGHVQHVVTD